MAQPQLTPQQLQQLADLYARIDGLSATAAQSAAQHANSIGNALNELTRLENAYRDLMADVSSTREAFANIVDDIKQMDSGVKRTTNAFRGLESLASKLQSHQDGFNILSSKELEILKKKSQDRTKELELAKRKAEQEVISAESLYLQDISNDKNRLAYERIVNSINEINSQLNENDSALNTFNEQLDTSLNKQKQVEKSLGASGALIKGMSKIPFLGDLPGMSSIVSEVEQEIQLIERTEGRIVSKSEAMKMTFGKMKGVIKESLTDPMVVTGFLVTQFVDAFKKADTAAGDLAKDFNITYNEANDVRKQLTQIAAESGKASLNTRALQESMVAVGKSLGSNAMLNQQDLETFTELREMAGYTNEELIGMQKLTLATGGNLKDNTKQFLGTVAALNAQNKLTINEKQLLKEVSNTSAAIKLSVGGTAKGLAESAFQAKQFGINLDQADRIAESLLNFESSITAELEAELITGKDLNLERARLLALNGDIAGASAEILKQIKGSAEFTKMNRIQQEAFADAVGMSREDLAASLIEREALNKLGEKDKTGIEAYNRLKKQGLSDDQIAVELGNEQYANQLKQQSVQERLTIAVEKMKEAFVSIIEVFSPILNIFADFISLISQSKLLLTGLQTVIAAMAVKSLVTAIASIFTGSAVLGPPGLIIAAAGTAALMGYIKSAQNIKDGMIAPDGGLVVSGPKGTYSLDKNDSVIAGTNLNKPVDRSTSSPQQDLSPLLAEMKALRQEQARANNKPTVIENSVNGTRFGTAVAMNTYKTQ